MTPPLSPNLQALLSKPASNENSQEPALSLAEPSGSALVPESVTLPLDTSSRWFFCGWTGSGKTFLAKHFLRRYARRGWPVVIFDTGHSWMWDEKKQVYNEWAHSGDGSIDRPRLVKRFNKRFLVQAYEPEGSEAMKDPGLMQFCNDVMKAGRHLVYIDETFGLMTATFCPEPVAALFVRGRKKQVAAWAGSQRPSRIPEVIMSQAENWAIFGLQNPSDREKVAQWTNTPAIETSVPPEWYWWYWQKKGGQPARMMRPIQ